MANILRVSKIILRNIEKKRNPRMSVEPIKNLSVFSYTSDENKYYGVRGWVNGVNGTVK